MLTAGKLWKVCLDSSFQHRQRGRAGWGIRMVLPPVRMDSIMFAVKAKMWYSGRAHTAGRLLSAHQRLLHHRLSSRPRPAARWRSRCGAAAPPPCSPRVLPVYCSRAMSSRLNVGVLSVPPRALGDGVVEAHGTGQVVGGHHFLDVAHHVVHQGALEQPSWSPMAHSTNAFDRRVRQAGLLQVLAKFSNDDDGLERRRLRAGAPAHAAVYSG